MLPDLVVHVLLYPVPWAQGSFMAHALRRLSLSPGASIQEHEAEGPITIQVLAGELELNAGGETRVHSVGALIAFDQRVRHAVSSSRGAMFLLTLSAKAA
jgi:quercetin dioxygenase-like cupin family protein